MAPLRFLRAKYREARLCLSAGRVTLPSPYEAADPPPGFRGLPSVDASRCIGCGGCASVCTPGLIAIDDDGPHARFTWSLARCIYCGRCAEVCPEEAVTMSPTFETATSDISALTMTVDVFMGSCSRCGRCYGTQTPLDPPHPRAHHQARVAAICDRYREAAS